VARSSIWSPGGSTTPRSDPDQNLTHPARCALIENFRAEMPVSGPLFPASSSSPRDAALVARGVPLFLSGKSNHSYSRWLSPAERSGYDPATPLPRAAGWPLPADPTAPLTRPPPKLLGDTSQARYPYRGRRRVAFFKLGTEPVTQTSVYTPTCGSPLGVVGNRDPLGGAAGVRGAVTGRYDCQ